MPEIVACIDARRETFALADAVESARRVAERVCVQGAPPPPGASACDGATPPDAWCVRLTGDEVLTRAPQPSARRHAEGWTLPVHEWICGTWRPARDAVRLTGPRDGTPPAALAECEIRRAHVRHPGVVACDAASAPAIAGDTSALGLAVAAWRARRGIPDTLLADGAGLAAVAARLRAVLESECGDRAALHARYDTCAASLLTTRPAAPGIDITVVLNTWNAETYLARVLDAVRGWAADIVIVDMHSDDGTCDIARAAGARVVPHEPLAYSEPARAFALQQARTPWMLVLDADEIAPPALLDTLAAAARAGDTDCLSLPRLNYIWGEPICHSGWEPRADTHLRFGRAGAIDWPPRIHARPRPAAGMRHRTLPADGDALLHHFNYTDIADFLERLARYTAIEARTAAAHGALADRRAAWRVAAREWMSRAVRHGGARAGWRGAGLATLMVFYRLLSDAWLAAGAPTAEECDQRALAALRDAAR